VFDTYRFENHETDESHVLDGWSYFWASLGGPVYVLVKGFGVSALLMLVISAAIAAAAAGALVFTVGFLDDLLFNLLAVAGIPVVALVAQGVIAIELVRAGYIRRGWREGY
jgi:ABC-type multidrug transport system fused ATPase/permease subunit